MENLSVYDVKSPLKNIQRIIQRDIPSFINSDYELDQETADYFIQAVQKETEAVKAGLSEARLYMKARDFKKCIHIHQHQLVTFIDSLSHYTSHSSFLITPGPLTKEILFHTVFVALESLLRFLEEYFPAYFNTQTWLPRGYRIILKEQLLYQLCAIGQRLKASAVDDDLINITLSPIYKFVQPVTPPDIDFKTSAYLRRLKDALLKLSDDPGLEPSKALHLLLHKHNFNSDEYAQYYITYMSTAISATAVTDYEKIQTLTHYHKLICQDTKNHIHLNPKEESLAEKLHTWISAEIKSIETCLTLPKTITQPYTTIPPNTADNAVSQQPKNKTASKHHPRKQRISITLSVSDIALCTRVFRDLYVFSERNVSEIMRHWAQGIETIGTDEPSFGNIKKSYYAPHQSSYDTILSLCRRITDYIQKQRMSR